MGRIVMSENVSLDGVIQDPNGDEGFEHGGWFAQISDEDRTAWGKAAFDEALSAKALLFGRQTYEFFASRWPSRTGPFADRLNTMPKYVVSSTLSDLDWTNSTVLHGDAVTAVSKLRQEVDGDIVLYASFHLVHTLLEHDLINELRMTIFPVRLGSGKRLFDESSNKTPMRLIESRTIGTGLAFLVYEFVPSNTP
jgi:dihydrofolate reductase